MTSYNFKTNRGNTYTYTEYGIDSTKWNSVGGNYIFGYKQADGYWAVLYCGQTNDLADRFANHEKLDAAKRLGATHILAHVNSTEAARLAEEEDMVSSFKPALNEKLK